MANVLRVLEPDKTDGMWVFDDPAAGLVQRPFVFGIPELFERLAALFEQFDKTPTKLFVEVEPNFGRPAGRQGA